MPRKSFAIRSDKDTDIGGGSSDFPDTHQSLVAEVASTRPANRALAYAAIVESYWKPAYKYIRIKWNKSNEDAKDLTQAFFAGAIERSFFKGYDPARARFRTFMRTCIDHFVANSDRDAARLKRGGEYDHFALDFEGAEAELGLAGQAIGLSMEEYFRREWVRRLFEISVNLLEAECRAKKKSIHFRLFELYDLDREAAGDISYHSLATRFQLSVSEVTNYLAFTRREFRKIALSRLRELTGSEEEYRSEARELLGVEIH